jgi:hypothetical protein
VNDSGKPISVASIALSGWYFTSSGSAAIGNDVPTTGNIEYPIGGTKTNMLSGGSTTLVNPNGSDLITDPVPLPASIPVGASFNVNLSITIAAGLFYNVGLGLSGVLTTTTQSGLKPALFGVGDSIVLNNGDLYYTVCSGRCPVIQMSIFGTRANAYAAGGGSGGFSRLVSLAKRLGISRFVCNWGTNDLGVSNNSAATVESNLQILRGLTNAQGILFSQATIMTQVGLASPIAITLLTSSGTTMTAVVADATQFAVNNVYVLAGATQTEYNGTFVAQTVNTVANTVTFIFAGSGTPTATGSPTLQAWKTTSSRAFQVPISPSFNGGASSVRAQLNALIRTPGNFDSYMEFADFFEKTRNDGFFITSDDAPDLLAPFTVNIVSGSNIGHPHTDYVPAAGRGTTNQMSGGLLQFTSGLDIGPCRTTTANTIGVFSMTSNLPNIPAIGDTGIAVAGGSYASSDGLHPINIIGGYGGQVILQNAFGSFLTSLGV